MKLVLKKYSLFFIMLFCFVFVIKTYKSIKKADNISNLYLKTIQSPQDSIIINVTTFNFKTELFIARSKNTYGLKNESLKLLKDVKIKTSAHPDSMKVFYALSKEPYLPPHKLNFIATYLERIEGDNFSVVLPKKNSWINIYNKTINWNGDFSLVAMPFVMSFLLSLVGTFILFLFMNRKYIFSNFKLSSNDCFLTDAIWSLLPSKLNWMIFIWLSLILSFYFYFIDKSFYFSDEAFYLFHFLSGVNKIASSNWFIIYDLFFQENLIINKVIISLLQLLGVFMFSLSFVNLFSELKNKHIIVLSSIGSLFLLLGPTALIAPSYVSLNTIAILFATAFLFHSFKTKSFLSMFLSGFCVGIIPFLMITNSPIFLLFIVLIWIYLGRLKNILVFILGALSFVSFYFGFIQSPDDFSYKFSEALNYMSYDDEHGLLNIIFWILNIIIEISPLIIFLTYYFLSKKYHFKNKSKLNLVVLFLLLIWVFLLLINTISSKLYIFNSILFYCLAIFLFVEARTLRLKKLFLISFLLLTPVFLSLGTTVNFFVRSIHYFPFVFIAIVYLLQIIKKRMYYISFFILMIIASGLYFSYPFLGSWEGFKGVESHQEFTFSKGTIYLDQKRLNKVKEIEPYISGKKNVIVSRPLLLGLLYLNEALPPFVFYKPNKATETYLIDNQYDYTSYIFIEDKDHLFEEKFLDKVTYNNFEKFHQIETKHFNIYKILKKVND